MCALPAKYIVDRLFHPGLTDLGREGRKLFRIKDNIISCGNPTGRSALRQGTFFELSQGSEMKHEPFEQDTALSFVGIAHLRDRHLHGAEHNHSRVGRVGYAHLQAIVEAPTSSIIYRRPSCV